MLLKVARPASGPRRSGFTCWPLGGSAAWRQPEFWLGLVYVTFPLGLVISGWNGLADRETDQLNPRKDTFLFGARPSPDELRRLPAWIASVQVPFLCAFLLIIGPRIVGWMALLIGATAIYNWPRIGFKNWPGVDMLNHSAICSCSS
jgi:4-hydroxybenzoate polyprenyltransferase